MFDIKFVRVGSEVTFLNLPWFPCVTATCAVELQLYKTKTINKFSKIKLFLPLDILDSCLYQENIIDFFTR